MLLKINKMEKELPLHPNVLLAQIVKLITTNRPSKIKYLGFYKILMKNLSDTKFIHSPLRPIYLLIYYTYLLLIIMGFCWCLLLSISTLANALMKLKLQHPSSPPSPEQTPGIWLSSVAEEWGIWTFGCTGWGKFNPEVSGFKCFFFGRQSH